jgi:hypothetical protein
MANEEQLSILKQGVKVWNKWREENPGSDVDLSEANLRDADLNGADLSGADLRRADLSFSDLSEADLTGALLSLAHLQVAYLFRANLKAAELIGTNLQGATLTETNFNKALVGSIVLGDSDLSDALGLDDVNHWGPSDISRATLTSSKGKISKNFLRGCGLSDWEVENVKLYNPDLNNEEISKILYEVYDLRASQALQISPLFISYSQANGDFVDKLETQLNEKGIRFWRDVHELKAGRLEKQIDRAIRQNPTVLLILSQNSLGSDWVEHEVRTARALEKDMGRDVLCPVALDDSWKSSRWPKRVMEQIMEYNILDFSEWEDDGKFDGMFRRLIDGLGLFYEG